MTQHSAAAPKRRLQFDEAAIEAAGRVEGLARPLSELPRAKKKALRCRAFL